MWLAVLAYTALITAPLTLAQNPVSTLQETASEAKHVRSGRGHLFLILSVFFFVEGLGILAYPTLAQRVSHPLPPSQPAAMGIHPVLKFATARAGLITLRTLLRRQCLQRHCLLRQYPVHRLGANARISWVKSGAEVMTDCKPVPHRPVGTGCICVEKVCDDA